MQNTTSLRSLPVTLRTDSTRNPTSIDQQTNRLVALSQPCVIYRYIMSAHKRSSKQVAPRCRAPKMLGHVPRRAVLLSGMGDPHAKPFAEYRRLERGASEPNLVICYYHKAAPANSHSNQGEMSHR